MANEPSMNDLRAEGKELGLTFGPGTTKAEATERIAAARESAPIGETGDAPGAQSTAGETTEIRKAIEHVTERGDWTDPFSGLITHFGNDRNPQSGAYRDGDEAVLVVPKGA